MNLQFLQKLKQKLQIGNARSVHLNVLPGKLATRLDLTDLNIIKTKLADEFIDKLLTESDFKFVFNLREFEEFAEENNLFSENKHNHSETRDKKDKIGLISKRLSSISYEIEDNLLEHGIKTFGFGFPILIYKSIKDPTKIIKAPIIIWNLELQKSKKKIGEWIISREEDYSITVNEVLLNYLQQDTSVVSFSRITEEQLEDGIINKQELSELVNSLLKTINAKSEDIIFNQLISKLPDKDTIEKSTKDIGIPYILFSGVFSLYRAQKEGIIKDFDKLIENFVKCEFDNLKIEKYQTVPFSAIETDPSQTNVLCSLGDKTKIIIHGPPGTGKSQSLTAIITNALVNKTKCLVVCEKRTALEVILNNLAKLGLKELCTIIEDTNRDRRKIVVSVRNRSEITKNYSPLPNKYNYPTLITKCQSLINKINEQHKFFSKNIIQQSNWKEIIGKYLKLTKQSSNIDFLRQNLNPTKFDFNLQNCSNDFTAISECIYENETIFKEIETNTDTFAFLNDNVFIYENPTETKNLIIENCEQLLLKINKVIQEGEALINDYKTTLNNHYSKYFNKIKEIKETATTIFNNGFNKYGELFLKTNILTQLNIIFLSIFSKNFKELKMAKKSFKELIAEFNDCNKTNNFNYVLSSINNEIILENLLNFCLLVEQWHSNIENFTEYLTKQFHLRNFDSHTQLDNNIQSFENSYHNLITQINKEVFNSFLRKDIAGVWEKTNHLNLITNKLLNLISNINNFTEYFYWRKHYLIQSENVKEIINCLSLCNSKNWVDDFEGWFIYNVLIKNENVDILRDDFKINELNKNLNDLMKQQIIEITNYWRKKQLESVENYKAKTSWDIKTLYNLRTNNQMSKKNSLRKIIQYDFELFTNHFPVLMLNPTVCSSLLELKEGMFDLVIFDEASQLRLEDTYCSMLRGKYKVVAGDEKQMPPSSYFASANITLSASESEEEFEDEQIIKQQTYIQVVENLADSESLLQFAENSSFANTFLEIHYRSRHPDLIEFSNAAFYGKRLNPMPAFKYYKAIEFSQINGEYDNSVNLEEAKKVIDIIINQVELNEDGEYPSVGIATFNIFQRNLILDEIKNTCINNTQVAEKFEKLKSKPNEELFVKNLENIQGDERDIIIISTTFGVRKDGRFIQNFGPINQNKGHRLLNVIITRAKHKIYICTSIPRDKFENYRTSIPVKGNKSTAIFYAYLAYANAIENEDTTTKESILNLLLQNCEEKTNYNNDLLTESIFEQEVVDSLIQFVDIKRMKTQYKLGGFRIDIVILSKDLIKPIIAIECDGAKYHSSNEAYAWDIFRQKHLENYGLKFIRIWSTNWWNSQKRELQKLLKSIEQFDK